MAMAARSVLIGRSAIRTSQVVQSTKQGTYNRGGPSGNGIAGIEGLLKGTDATKGLAELYAPEQLQKIRAIAGGERDPTKRMKARFSGWYVDLARRSQPLRNLILPHQDESLDLSGEADPSNQNRYSPVPGMLHKYEMGLLYVVKTCSAHCRYCYRLDLFSGKTSKRVADIEEVQKYILRNNAAAAAGALRPATGEPAQPLSEVLLSGGDPMLLTNKQLATYLVGLAEVGVEKIRIGTKELAFFPARFCGDFMAMLDAFHAQYPHVHLRFVHHISHPDEVLDPETGRWHEQTAQAVSRLRERAHFVALDNQAPIIRGVNDDAEALRVLQKELYSRGISPHYFFQCRMIEGNKFFAVPVEETLEIFQRSQFGLSGVEKKARLCMSTEQGKVEVLGTLGDQILFRAHRHPQAERLGSLVAARRDPEALWITDYIEKGLVTSDPDGVFIEASPSTEPAHSPSLFQICEASGVAHGAGFSSIQPQ